MKIAILGYGKMGKAIEEVALSRNHEIVVKINDENLADFTQDNLRQADVAIEFTGPHSAFENVKQCMLWKIPVVCGSTGWLQRLEEIRSLCISNNTGFIYASNFSVGVNIFFELNKRLAALMNTQKEYEVRVEEIHHTQKKDSPSGTAITLAEQIIENIDRKKSWVNHISDNTDELEIISERTDPAPGTHKVIYTSPVDDIEIIHTAHSRKGFALGAVLAAEFLMGRKGVFSMKDVLKF